MPVTIEDVARHLSLSVSTVSKALNDYPDISAETKARVVEVAQGLGYHPSAAARSLRRRQTDRIGVVNPSTTYNFDYFFEMLRGVTVAAEQRNYNLVLYTNVHDDPHRLQRICRSQEVDGVVLMSASDIADALDAFEAEDLPMVVLGRRETRPEISYVAHDAFAGGALVTRHLIGLGHRRIGYLAAPLDVQTSNDKLDGYRQALQEAGIPFDPALVSDAPFRPRGGCEAMAALLQQDPRPTAVIAFSDTIAFEALQTIGEHALRVPRDIALAAFDDVRLSLLMTPPLTTVRQPLFEMGQRAVEMLLARIAHRDQAPERIICPVTLVIRESTVESAT
jgi:LacI family transcriptional regulator